MTKLSLFIAAAAGALLLSSCYLMTPGSSGTIRLDFAGTPSRAVSGTSGRVRVYLFSWASASSSSLYTFPATGLDYTEASYPGTVTLSNVPPGQWQAAVSIGSDGTSGSFQTTSYGKSAVFSVQVGGSTSVSITTAGSSIVYSPSLEGVSLTSVQAEASYLYYSTSASLAVYASSQGTLYEGPLSYSTTSGLDLTTTPINAVSGLPGGTVINSLGFGFTNQPVLLVNTNQGVFPFNDATVPNGFDPTALPPLLTSQGTPVNVLQSANGFAGNFLADYYASPTGFGGVYVMTSGTPWVTINLSGTTPSDPVYGFATDYFIGDGLLYAATKGGAFWAPESIVDSALNPTGSLASAHYFTAPNGEAIDAVAVVFPSSLNITSFGNGILYIGTAGGAFSAPITETAAQTVTIGSFSPVPGTAGKQISAIATSDYPDAATTSEHVYVAFRATQNIIVLNETTNVSTSYPFYAGFPGTLTSMCWVGGRLLLAGSEGLAAIVIGPVGIYG